jgi:hypothetical protein
MGRPVQADTFAFRKEFIFYNKSHPDPAPIVDLGLHSVSYKLANEILINTDSLVNADNFVFRDLLRYGIRIQSKFWIQNYQ